MKTAMSKKKRANADNIGSKKMSLKKISSNSKAHKAGFINTSRIISKKYLLSGLLYNLM